MVVNSGGIGISGNASCDSGRVPTCTLPSPPPAKTPASLTWVTPLTALTVTSGASGPGSVSVGIVLAFVHGLSSEPAVGVGSVWPSSVPLTAVAAQR